MTGSTSTPESVMYPTPSGCDPTQNGGSDAFVLKHTQPI
jgi:hypothetical protein